MVPKFHCVNASDLTKFYSLFWGGRVLFFTLGENIDMPSERCQSIVWKLFGTFCPLNGKHNLLGTSHP